MWSQVCGMFCLSKHNFFKRLFHDGFPTGYVKSKVQTHTRHGEILGCLQCLLVYEYKISGSIDVGVFENDMSLVFLNVPCLNDQLCWNVYIKWYF
jgi:hypothetical protein